MQQHLQRLDGVAKADVSLRDGKVVVLPKEGGALDPQKVMQATYDSGVSVAAMEITAAGTLEESADKLTFRITPNLAYQATANEQTAKVKSQGSLGKKISLRGRVYQKPEKAPRQKAAPKLATIDIIELVGRP